MASSDDIRTTLQDETFGGASLLHNVEKQAATVVSLAKKVKHSDAVGDSERTAKLMGQLVGSIEELAGLLEPLRATARREAERADREFLEFGAGIKAACDARGWRLEGSWPTLYVDRGISIEVDDKNRLVSVGGRKLSSPRVGVVIAALEPLVRDLIPKGFDSKRFIGELASAYDETNSRSGQLPLFDVYRSMVIQIQSSRFWRDASANSFVGLSMDQFRARLSRSLADGVTTSPDGRALRLLPPLNPKDGVFLYQPAEVRFGFVGRIEFVENEGGAL